MRRIFDTSFGNRRVLKGGQRCVFQIIVWHEHRTAQSFHNPSYTAYLQHVQRDANHHTFRYMHCMTILLAPLVSYVDCVEELHTKEHRQIIVDGMWLICLEFSLLAGGKLFKFHRNEQTVLNSGCRSPTYSIVLRSVNLLDVIIAFPHFPTLEILAFLGEFLLRRSLVVLQIIQGRSYPRHPRNLHGRPFFQEVICFFHSPTRIQSMQCPLEQFPR